MKSIYPKKDMGLEITTISPLAKSIYDNYPDLVSNYYRYNPVTTVVSAGDKYFKENVAIGDTTLVSMFGFELLHGDPAHAFTSISSAVITEDLAKRFFGTTDAIGRVITVQTTKADIKQDYQVSAVLKTLPKNSVTNLLANSNYNVFVASTGNRFFGDSDPSLEWDHTNYLSFIELKPGVSAETVTAKLNNLLRKNSPDYIWQNLTASIVPVRSYYLNDNDGAVRKMIQLLILIASFILCMVTINFININIGISGYRLKEIGLRKLFGTTRRRLIFQGIAETAVITIIACACSVVGYELLRPLFTDLLNSSLPHLWQLAATEYIFLTALIVCLIFLAGFYPAFVLSSTRLLLAVKGKISQATGGLILKRILLVVQFSLTALVFICTLQVSRQVNYIFKKDLGYNREQLMIVNAFPKKWDSAGVAHMQAVLKGLNKIPAITSGTLSFDLPDGKPNQNILAFPVGVSDPSQAMSLPILFSDENYAATYGIKVKSGNFFAESHDGIVLNETAVKQLGFTNEDIIGKEIKTGDGSPLKVRGVIHDYHFSSLQDQIGPIGFTYVRSIYRYLTLRINTQDLSGTIAAMRKTWRDFSPMAPFDYTFMDEKFAKLYEAELRLQKASVIATIINILIVLLGIIGVIAFMLARREREIAIRKVLGAGARQIISLFAKEYAVLLLIANLLAWPIAYYVSGELLQNFAYRVNQSLTVYVIVFAILCLLSSTLIGIQCFRTAVSNPVKGLKHE